MTSLGKNPFLPPWLDDVNTAARVMASISVIVSAFTIVTFLIFPVRRKYPVRLPLYLCVASFGLSLFSLITARSACAFQSVGLYYFGTACWVWWGIISFNFYDVMVRGNTASFDKREGIYNAIGWGVPLLFTIVSKATDVLDTERPIDGELWECFIKARPIYYSYVSFYGWLGLTVFVGLFIWPRCLWKVYRSHLYTSLSRAESIRMLAYSRHMFFMVIFFIYFAVLIAFHIELDTDDDPPESMIMAKTILITSIGFFSFLLFGFSTQNFQLWKGLITQGTVNPKVGDSPSEEDSLEAPLDVDADDVYLGQVDIASPQAARMSRSVRMHPFGNGAATQSNDTRGLEKQFIPSGRAYSAEFHSIDDVLGVRSSRGISLAAAAAAAAAAVASDYHPPELSTMMAPTGADGDTDGVAGGYDISKDLYAASVYMAGSSLPISEEGNDMNEGLYSIIGQSPSTFDSTLLPHYESNPNQP